MPELVRRIFSLGHSAGNILTGRCFSVFLAVPLVISAVYSPSPEASNSHSQEDAEARQLLLESVHILGGHRKPFVRWYEPVRVAVVGEVSEAVSNSIISIFNEISLLSGVPVSLLKHDFESADAYASALSHSAPYDLSVCNSADSSLCANFVIVVADKEAMSQVTLAMPMRPVFQKAVHNSDDLLCFFSPGVLKATEIVQSVVYIQSDISEAMQTTCLQEEIYQSFGLFDDFTDSQFFSFNNEVQEKEITVYDKRLLTSLYDNAFARGSSAIPVARQLVEYCGTNC